MLILGIESSCDETSLALFDQQQGLIDQVLHSQIDQHAVYGGVVPEIAARAHADHIVPLYQLLLDRTQIKPTEIDAVAYTAGPGLVGALMVGACFGHSLAESLRIPKIPVNHLEGHIMSAWLPHSTPQWPCIVLLVSGGHTALIFAQGLGQYTLLGETLDDAVGEAFDKTAKIMGLPYPGGIYIDQLSLKGDANAFDLPRPLLHRSDYQFSFSGLKTAVARAWSHSDQTEQARCDLAASFQAAVIDCLTDKTIRALNDYSASHLVVVGGVSANQGLRAAWAERLPQLGTNLIVPDVVYCTDNAAMIAAVGAYYCSNYRNQRLEAIEVRARWPISSI